MLATGVLGVVKKHGEVLGTEMVVTLTTDHKVEEKQVKYAKEAE